MISLCNYLYLFMMTTVLHKLTQLFQKAAQKAYPTLDPSIPLEVTQSTSNKFGHYQFNSAMRMAKPLKCPPRAIAEKLIAALDENKWIASLEVAGPGFINITLSPEALSEEIETICRDEHLGIEKPQQKERIIVEFSSPNVAKELHVGHLRSTIIGDCLARLFEFLGHDVFRLNHIGDWGTQFGMLIAYMKEEAPDVLRGEKKTDLSHLVAWYRASKKRFDEDEAFKKKAQLEVPKLQSGAPDSIQAWNILCTISREAYQEIYDLLGINISERGESFYNPMLEGLIEDLEQKQLLKESEGAKCIFIEGFNNREGKPLPLILQKSDGGYGYATTDMAAIRHRFQEEKADRVIVVTDMGQSTHFKMFSRAAELAGYFDPGKQRFDHVTFGLVLGPDGKKFKTRAGETERLIDLITTAIEKADAILKERTPELSTSERSEMAKALGINAIKYADLCCHRTGDYTFSYDRMLRFEGNTAAYLMYSYVRVAGIKRRVGIDINQIKDPIKLTHPSETALGVHLIQFGETLEQVAQELLPNRLTDYLYGLAEKFNAFFRDCRVEGSDEQNSRLLLCETVARTMHQGLEILGLKTLERM